MARFLGYFSRKGRKGAKDTKEEKRVLVCYLRLLITRYAHLQNPFLLFPLRPWRPLRLCERNYRRHCAEGADVRSSIPHFPLFNYTNIKQNHHFLKKR